VTTVGNLNLMKPDTCVTIYNRSVPTSQRTHAVSDTKTNVV